MTDVSQPEWLKGFTPTPTKGKMGNPHWKPGMPCPNPAGRPKDTLSKRDKIARALNDDGPGVVRVVIDAALAGDMQAAALVLARCSPALRSQTERVQFPFDPDLPIGKQIEQVLAGIASGAVAADIGQQIIASIGTLSSVRATEELEQRIVMLEAKAI